MEARYSNSFGIFATVGLQETNALGRAGLPV